MKKLLAISAVALLAASSAAIAGEGVKSAYGGCGYGASLKTATAVPTYTPAPVNTVIQTASTAQTGK